MNTFECGVQNGALYIIGHQLANKEEEFIQHAGHYDSFALQQLPYGLPGYHIGLHYALPTYPACRFVIGTNAVISIYRTRT
jgi:hypothetical protein